MEGPEWMAGPAQGRPLTIDEAPGVFRLVYSWLVNGLSPLCDGRVTVHADGRAECDGGCSEIAAAPHAATQMSPCDLSQAVMRLDCSRCRA